VDVDSKELIERGMAGPFGDSRWDYGEFPNDPAVGPVPRRINGLADDDMPPSFRLLMAYPPLLAAASALMGGGCIAAAVPGALVYKVPRRGFPVPWHQDPVVVRRFPTFNVDVYLDKSDEANACVWAIPGSHLGGYHEDQKALVHSWTKGVAAGDETPPPGAVPVLTEPGDVLVHATSVLHGSGWNRSDRLRRTLYYHFDSWEDVNLGGGYATQAAGQHPHGRPSTRSRPDFASALARHQKAVELRKKTYPEEPAFSFVYPCPPFDPPQPAAQPK
jgi:hypothetical protein